MQFIVKREEILKPLQIVAGAVERRQTFPILSNVLLVVKEPNQLVMTATDLEVELTGRVQLDQMEEGGETTVSARKLLDICRTLPNDSMITFKTEQERLLVRSGKSRFVLYTLATDKFPNVEESQVKASFTLPQNMLKTMIEGSHFTMAHQDVRYYLMGMLLDLNTEGLTLAATDGHRLSVASLRGEALLEKNSTEESLQVIIPRKGIVELLRLLEDVETTIQVSIGANHISAVTPEFTFISKLIEGRYPDYRRVIPEGGRSLSVNREAFKRALTCVSILSGEKGRGVRFLLTPGSLKLFSNNPEQEEAEEEVSVVYDNSEFEVGFNVDYLIDVAQAVKTDEMKLIFSDADDSLLTEETKDQTTYVYVVKPMRL